MRQSHVDLAWLFAASAGIPSCRVKTPELSSRHRVVSMSKRRARMDTARRKMLKTAGAGSLAVLGLVGNAWGQSKAATRKIVLGQSVPLTGAADQIGLAYAAGAKLYVDAFNARK